MPFGKWKQTTADAMLQPGGWAPACWTARLSVLYRVLGLATGPQRGSLLMRRMQLEREIEREQ